jgi:hypothetical protein
VAGWANGHFLTQEAGGLLYFHLVNGVVLSSWVSDSLNPPPLLPSAHFARVLKCATRVPCRVLCRVSCAVSCAVSCVSCRVVSCANSASNQAA